MFTPKGAGKRPMFTVLCSMQLMDILRGYEPFTRDNSPLLSVTKTDVLFNGLRAQHTGTITVELRYNDNRSKQKLIPQDSVSQLMA